MHGIFGDRGPLRWQLGSDSRDKWTGKPSLLVPFHVSFPRTFWAASKMTTEKRENVRLGLVDVEWNPWLINERGIKKECLCLVSKSVAGS